jgi:hypothetical protein
MLKLKIHDPQLVFSQDNENWLLWQEATVKTIG